MKVVLGVDIGTTSVKVSCIQFHKKDNFKILKRSSLAYDNHLKSGKFKYLKNEFTLDDLNKVGETNPFLILSSLVHCINQIDIDTRKKVKAIGICGQMHGVLFWNKECLKKIRSIDELKKNLELNLEFDKDFKKLASNLINWEDHRCHKEFLDELPDNSDFRNRKAYTGYGLATTFWFLKNNPNYLNSYSYLGSIQDFLIQILCTNLEHPVTSIQLANSYGYFDINKNEWSKSLDDEKFKFPKHLLPIVKNNDQIVARLKYQFLELKIDTVIFVALGDLQCAIYSATHVKDQTAILNFGTSMQLAFPISKEDLNNIKSLNLLKLLESKISLPNDLLKNLNSDLLNSELNSLNKSAVHLEIVPYFEDKFLVTSSSLNGGNVLAFFIKSIRKFITDLFEDIELNDNYLWTRITSLAKSYIDTNLDENNSDLTIEPRLYGERYEEIKSKFSIKSINSNNFELGRLYFKLCSSIISNIFSMCPIELLKEFKITKLCIVGSKFNQNEILRICLEKKLNKEKLDLIYENEIEADFGVCKWVFQHLDDF